MNLFYMVYVFLPERQKLKKTMKSKILMTMMLGLALVFSSYTLMPPEKYEIEISSSTVQWTGYHLAKSYAHTGKINIKSGTLEVENGDLVSGKIVIDMSTITDEDLTKEKDNAKLVKHLKSEDFFYASEYPESILTIKNVKKGEGDVYNVSGDITIRGITENIEFEAKKHGGSDGSVKYSASLKVDRTKHEVLYGWSLENMMLGDTFDLEVELVANKAVN